MAKKSKQGGLSINDCVMVDAQVIGAGHYVFVAHSAAALRADSYICRVVEYRDGNWALLAEWPWQAVALALTSSAPLAVAVLGRDGQAGTWADGSAAEGKIDPQRPVGPFRGIRKLGADLFAFGMKREVYRLPQGGTWTRMMEGMEKPPPDGKLSIKEQMRARLADVGGINALAVDGTGELLAFGMKGEIWRRTGALWVKVDSPTNVMLQDAAEVPDAGIFVCGQVGTVLNGSGSTWSVVSYIGPEGLDFRSICAFNAVLFLADGHSLRFLDNGELKLVDFGVQEVVPCVVVVAGPERVLSVAGQEVWESADGLQWKVILG